MSLPRPRLLFRRTSKESSSGIKHPVYPGDCGHDLVVSERRYLQPGQFTDLQCGLEIALPYSTWGLILGRSSTFRRKGLHVVPGVIDSGYRGPICVGVWNAGPKPIAIEPGERLAQLIVIETILPILEQVKDLPPSERGTKAFGSTGS